MTKEANNHRKSAAIRIAQERGPLLALEHPEIADLYRQGQIQRRIAQIFVPDFDRSPSVAEGIVNYAIRELIPDNGERRRLQYAHLVAKVTAQGPNGNAAKEFGRRLTLARGQQPISDEVRQCLHDLLCDPKFSLQAGSRKGHQNLIKIGDEIDTRFGVRLSYGSIRLANWLRNRSQTREEYYAELKRKKAASNLVR